MMRRALVLLLILPHAIIAALLTLWNTASAVWPVSIILLFVLAVVLTSTILVNNGVLGTGFAGKTLWDWLEVVGVPVIAVLLAGVFGMAAQRTSQRAQHERELEADRAREATLRTYLDRMTDLVIHQGLQDSGEGSPVRAVAHAQTFAALRTLDGPRKGILARFLHEAGLINKEQPAIPLSEADLTRADLGRANLRGASLCGATLRSADLHKADLRDADLCDAVVAEADLHDADLRDAIVTNKQLASAEYLAGATMPDGSEMTEERWEQFREEFLNIP